MLKLAFGIWMAAAAADNVTTYRAITQPPAIVNGVEYRIGEGNPLLQPLQDRPTLLVGVASAIDVGSGLLWWKVGRQHKWVAVSAMLGQAALRGFFVARNLDTIREHEARLAQMPRGLVRLR